MATFRLKGAVVVEGYPAIHAINDVKIKKSLNNYVDTATVSLPATVVLKEGVDAVAQRVDTSTVFKRGQKIAISLQYEGETIEDNIVEEEFTGFISNIKRGIPCVLECEGYYYQLRDKSINKTYVNPTVKEILEDLIVGTDIELSIYNDDVTLDREAFLNISRSEALAQLSKDLLGHVRIWFVGKVLHAGLAYTYFSNKNKENKPDVVYKTGYNLIRDDSIQDVEVDKKDQYVVEVKDQSGKKSSAVVKSGGVKLKKTAILNTNSAKKAGEELNLLSRYTTEGTLTGFLVPFTAPGMKVKLIDPRYPELDGNYLIDEVEVTYSRSGARRKNKIGIKL